MWVFGFLVDEGVLGFESEDDRGFLLATKMAGVEGLDLRLGFVGLDEAVVRRSVGLRVKGGSRLDKCSV